MNTTVTITQTKLEHIQTKHISRLKCGKIQIAICFFLKFGWGTDIQCYI